ncbi:MULTISPECIES: hypothetical protein [Nocardiopsidaceae]|uniref:GNAT family N-acetyltransferase n=1 Tax=Streptomonospora nanhaiensis TaxID=1323731 RepID=A0ABY6YGY9_9ACTN|nr:hypothetical protein [Streptomonospora nanhaiensis]MEE2044467.1 hypothetical protein [Nocardiopsis tropica]WAE71501.1 hypothetical protein OUQ99_19950 [Streptomonospora nanhaiensis]
MVTDRVFRGLGRARERVNRFMADARNAGARSVSAVPDEGAGAEEFALLPRERIRHHAG